MNVSELINKLKKFPSDSTVAVYAEDDRAHLPNVFIKNVIIDDYSEIGLGEIVEIVI